MDLIQGIKSSNLEVSSRNSGGVSISRSTGNIKTSNNESRKAIIKAANADLSIVKQEALSTHGN